MTDLHTILRSHDLRITVQDDIAKGAKVVLIRAVSRVGGPSFEVNTGVVFGDEKAVERSVENSLREIAGFISAPDSYEDPVPERWELPDRW